MKEDGFWVKLIHEDFGDNIECFIGRKRDERGRYVFCLHMKNNRGILLFDNGESYCEDKEILDKKIKEF